MGSIHSLEDLLRQTASVLIETKCADQCISGSAILLKVLQQQGYPDAYPLTVCVTIVNPKKPENGIKLGKGTDPIPGKWPGHLVVVVPKYQGDDHLLIDLTLGQVNGKVSGISIHRNG